MLNKLICFLVILFLSMFIISNPNDANAGLVAGNIYVADEGGVGTEVDGEDRGVLFLVDPTTGNRTIISDFGDISQGPLGDQSGGVIIDSMGRVLVLDRGEDLLFIVDVSTGNRTVLSDFNDGNQGPTSDFPEYVDVDASGNIFVLTLNGGTGVPNLLFQVDPSNGNRTIISDYSNNAQGPSGTNPGGLAIDGSGNILANEREIEDMIGDSALLRIDPATGIRTILSDFTDSNQGPAGNNFLNGVTLENNGNILVVDGNGITNGTLFRVDPTTGDRTVVSDFQDSNQGTLGDEPRDAAVVPPQPTPEPPSGPIVIIPTMGQWGMIFATIILGIFAVIRLRRKVSE